MIKNNVEVNILGEKSNIRCKQFIEGCYIDSNQDTKMGKKISCLLHCILAPIRNPDDDNTDTTKSVPINIPSFTVWTDSGCKFPYDLR